MGRASEEIVARHLTAKGYTIIARNFHAPGGELDIICIRNNTLFVVEVRSRRYGATRPIDTIGPDKQRHIFDAVDAFMALHKPMVHEVRFIVAEVEWRDDTPEIRLIFDPFIGDGA